MLRLLALDPATNCGYAYFNGTDTESGTWELQARRDESKGIRTLRLKKALMDMHAKGLDLVCYEAARHAAPGMQGALVTQAELQGVIKLYCEEHGIEYAGYSPSEIKKAATGKGNAGKEDVRKAVAEAVGYMPATTDEADALALLALARQQYG